MIPDFRLIYYSFFKIYYDTFFMDVVPACSFSEQSFLIFNLIIKITRKKCKCYFYHIFLLVFFFCDIIFQV